MGFIIINNPDSLRGSADGRISKMEITYLRPAVTDEGTLAPIGDGRTSSFAYTAGGGRVRCMIPTGDTQRNLQRSSEPSTFGQMGPNLDFRFAEGSRFHHDRPCRGHLSLERPAENRFAVLRWSFQTRVLSCLLCSYTCKIYERKISLCRKQQEKAFVLNV